MDGGWRRSQWRRNAEREEEGKEQEGANFGASTLFNVYSFKTPNMRRKHNRDYMAEARHARHGTTEIIREISLNKVQPLERRKHERRCFPAR